jgi:hypothetical protein
MGQPEYRKKHKLNSQNLPLDTFWLEIADPESHIVECIDVVRSTDTISFNDMIQGHLVAHWLIVLYFYGWGHYTINYMKKVHGIDELEFVSNWIEYFQNKDNLIGQEHRNTMQSLTNVFNDSALWGRLVIENENVYWEFKSATSVVIHKNREKFSQCLANFLVDVYGVQNSQLVNINMDMCVDWQQQYPVHKTYESELTNILFGIDSGCLTIDHWDTSICDDTQFVKVAYHYQRKNRYWKCSVSATDS